MLAVWRKEALPRAFLCGAVVAVGSALSEGAATSVAIDIACKPPSTFTWFSMLMNKQAHLLLPYSPDEKSSPAGC